MTRIDLQHVTVVILAGGMGRRMGGQDKGLVNYRGRPLIEHVLDAVRLQTENILINANRNTVRYAEFGFAVVKDGLTGFQGPLSGFLAAMEFVDSDFILTLPCDGPIVDPNYVHNMLRALNDASSDIVVASDGVRMQPVYALIPVRLAGDLRDFLRAGERKIDTWYARHTIHQQVFSAESGFFTNINTLEELQG